MEVKLSKFEKKEHVEASKIKLVFWVFVSSIFFKNSTFVFNKFKIFLLRMFGAQIGRGVIFYPNVQIKYPWKLKIGDFCWIGEHVWIDNLDHIEIGKNVCISQGAYLLTGNHNYKSENFDLLSGSITLEDGVWIGAKSVICPGVVCHSHSVLSVHSVATKNLDPYKIYQGNPAIFIRKRTIVASKS